MVCLELWLIAVVLVTVVCYCFSRVKISGLSARCNIKSYIHTPFDVDFFALSPFLSLHRVNFIYSNVIFLPLAPCQWYPLELTLAPINTSFFNSLAKKRAHNIQLCVNQCNSERVFVRIWVCTTHYFGYFQFWLSQSTYLLSEWLSRLAKSKCACAVVCTVCVQMPKDFRLRTEEDFNGKTPNRIQSSGE